MNAILLIAHELNALTLRRLDALRRVRGFDVFLLLDATHRAGAVDDLAGDARVSAAAAVVTFNFNDVLAVGYRPVAPTIVPGSIHLPVIRFVIERGYDHVWAVECDVAFAGDWQEFFEAHDSQADLMTARIRPFRRRPNWWWWRSFHGPAPLPREHLFYSFNPVFRISAAAAAYLDARYRGGWMGHGEATMPSLLHAGGFGLEDLGGTGLFATDRNRGRWYTNASYSHKASNLYPPEDLRQVLIHPVKAECVWDCGRGRGTFVHLTIPVILQPC